MRYASSAFVLLAALALQVPQARAVPMEFVGNLSGTNEVPPNASPGTGVAKAVLDPTAQTIQITASFSGLTSPDAAAHIHCCAPLGTNAGVATTVPAFLGFPLGVTQGTYLSPVFSLLDPSFYNPAFVSLEGGLPQAEAALIAGIENQQTYFNIHTTNFPGGEIRSQLFSAAAPEPASLVLLGSALIGFGMIRRRNRVPLKAC
jgi:hypothetical protein